MPSSTCPQDASQRETGWNVPVPRRSSLGGTAERATGPFPPEVSHPIHTWRRQLRRSSIVTKIVTSPHPHINPMTCLALSTSMPPYGTAISIAIACLGVEKKRGKHPPALAATRRERPDLYLFFRIIFEILCKILILLRFLGLLLFYIIESSS